MDDELLECNPNDLLCGPTAPATTPTPTPAPEREVPALDDAASDLLGQPEGSGVLLDPGAPHAPELDLPGPAPTPAPTPAEPPDAAQPAPSRPRFRYPEPHQNLPQHNRQSPRPREEPAETSVFDDDNRGRGPYGFDWREEEENGPYLYGEFRPDQPDRLPGVTLGGGIGAQRDPTLDVDGPRVQFGAGSWADQDGTEYEGIRLNGGVLDVDGHAADERDPTHGQIGLFNFDGGIYDDGDTFNAGYSANAGEAEVTFGDTASEDSDSDSSISFSGSAGVPSGGFRLHHGDADGDGLMEAGIGISTPLVGVDIRSELVHRAMRDADDAYSHLGERANAAFGVDWFD